MSPNLENYCDTEEWRPFPGWEAGYAISSWGRVKRIARTTITKKGHSMFFSEREVKPYDVGLGYLVVKLSIGLRHSTNLSVHRAVALAFISNPEGKSEVNHKDAEKANNHVSNLEWCSRAENVRHAFALGLYPSRKGKNSPSYGRPVSAKTRALISEANQIRQRFPLSGEVKAKIGKANQGRVYINDGSICRMVTSSEVDGLLAAGWQRRRLLSEATREKLRQTWRAKKVEK